MYIALIFLLICADILSAQVTDSSLLSHASCIAAGGIEHVAPSVCLCVCVLSKRKTAGAIDTRLGRPIVYSVTTGDRTHDL